MGTGSSRQRPRPQLPAYPPPNVYQQQVPPYYPDAQFINTGQYGQWRPPPSFVPPPGPFVPGPPSFQCPPMPPAVLPPPHVPQQEATPTTTIRNSVNLKKASLKVVPVGGNPSRLSIEFEFDASDSCCVSTFVVALEEQSKGCQLTQAKQGIAKSVIYDKGLAMKFPKAGAPPAIINVSLYDERQLLHAEAETYPLVIRLEAISESGKAESHTLQELKPGAPQKVWVQSQTTFAALVKNEDGHWTVRVLKQKIWVDGISYELQEIFGLHPDASASEPKTGPSSYEENEELLCVICLVNDRDTTVLPCRHMCMCQECAQELRKQTSKCPICRVHVDSLLHIKRGRQGKKQAVDSAAAATAAVNELKL